MICPHREGIHTSGKIRFFEKWSRDTPKMPILAHFGPFLEVFVDFLKNGSNDFFLTSCIENSKYGPGNKLCPIHKFFSYDRTVGAYIWLPLLFQPDFRHFGLFLQSKMLFRRMNYQIVKHRWSTFLISTTFTKRGTLDASNKAKICKKNFFRIPPYWIFQIAPGPTILSEMPHIAILWYTGVSSLGKVDNIPF